jgi:hypothetical protein
MGPFGLKSGDASERHLGRVVRPPDIFTYFDRRVNLKDRSESVGVYELARAWVQNDPYRRPLPPLAESARLEPTHPSIPALAPERGDTLEPERVASIGLSPSSATNGAKGSANKGSKRRRERSAEDAPPPGPQKRRRRTASRDEGEAERAPVVVSNGKRVTDDGAGRVPSPRSEPRIAVPDDAGSLDPIRLLSDHVERFRAIAKRHRTAQRRKTERYAARLTLIGLRARELQSWKERTKVQ